MALIVSKDAGAKVIGSADRSAIIAAALKPRKEEAPAAAPAETPAIAEKPAEPAAPAAPAAQDPSYVVEIERHARALESVRHQHELTKRELESLRDQLKDPDAALRAAGFSPDAYIERYLGGEAKPAAAAPAAPTGGPEHELLRRIEQLEAEKEQERAAARARSRRQEIAALIPSDSEDFELMHAMGDVAMDEFYNQFTALEKNRPGGIGPNEIKQLLGNFEGSTRKNVQAQLSRLAKTKWFRSMVTELLKSSGETAPAPTTSAQTAPASPTEAQPANDRASMPLRGREQAMLRERVKHEFARRRGLI